MGGLFSSPSAPDMSPIIQAMMQQQQQQMNQMIALMQQNHENNRKAWKEEHREKLQAEVEKRILEQEKINSNEARQRREKVNKEVKERVEKSEEKFERELQALKDAGVKYIPTNKLISKYDNEACLGSGVYGEVYLAMFAGEPVAVKILKGNAAVDAKGDDAALFHREVITLKSLHHENIVKFLGYINGDVNIRGVSRKVLGIVTQYIPGNDLAKIIEFPEDTDKSLTDFIIRNAFQPKFFERRLKILQGIALGMEYIHKVNGSHRDLKAENVMVYAGSNVKILDFGLSRICGTTGISKLSSVSSANERATVQRSIGGRSINVTRSGMGTPIYMAPEVHALFPDTPGKVTIKDWQMADVYAFGILCYELICSERAWKDIIDKTDLARRVMQAERPSFPDEIWDKDDVSELAYLAQDCWDSQPTERPTFSSIVEVLKKIEQMNTTGSRLSQCSSNRERKSKYSTRQKKQRKWESIKIQKTVRQTGPRGRTSKFSTTSARKPERQTGSRRTSKFSTTTNARNKSYSNNPPRRATRDSIQKLIELGFSESKAREALFVSDGDLDKAIKYLFN